MPATGPGSVLKNKNQGSRLKMIGRPPGTSHSGSSMKNGRPLDPADKTVMDVNYFQTAGFEEQGIKWGPALNICKYHVKPLQAKHLNNSSQYS
ncbi:unnamed protein product [Nyctereutes procyonoides]|uniref:(raccoon dog) hypothetical protein n=1 Tax=Nyctereutes procyonoides TaxID=34880 RepID=A0A811XZQ6_NYCPR|nr:unnamed protein product [Nyctereutes procyonoides]